MKICKIDQRYLENLVGVTLVHLEVLDGDGTSRVFSVAHVCESTVVVNTSDVYDLVLENIRGGYDTLGFADLGKKP